MAISWWTSDQLSLFWVLPVTSVAACLVILWVLSLFWVFPVIKCSSKIGDHLSNFHYFEFFQLPTGMHDIDFGSSRRDDMSSMTSLSMSRRHDILNNMPLTMPRWDKTTFPMTCCWQRRDDTTFPMTCHQQRWDDTTFLMTFWSWRDDVEKCRPKMAKISETASRNRPFFLKILSFLAKIA